MDAKAAASIACSLIQKLERSLEDKAHKRLLTLFQWGEKWYMGITRDLSADIAPELVLVLLSDEELPKEVVQAIKNIRRRIVTLRISDEVVVTSSVFVAHLSDGIIECVTEQQDGALQVVMVNVPARSLPIARKKHVGN